MPTREDHGPDDLPAPLTPGRGLGAAAARVLDYLLAAPLAPGLYVVATPIGNLADITLRALSVLARAETVYCEDTRHSLKLMQHYGLNARLLPYHEHNAERERPRVLAALAAGRCVALISDAGTPLISDPGYKLVREARAAGFPVWSLPGPSAPIAALAAAGLPTDCFTFEGFLPVRSGARRNRLAEISRDRGTLVLFEAPQRLPESLADMAAVLGPRPAAVARELTKLHEEVRLGTLPELAAWASAAPVKGEIVVLIAPGEPVIATDATIRAHLKEALASLSLRDAAKSVADALAVPRTRVYELGLQLRRDGGDATS